MVLSRHGQQRRLGSIYIGWHRLHRHLALSDLSTGQSNIGDSGRVLLVWHCSSGRAGTVYIRGQGDSGTGGDLILRRHHHLYLDLLPGGMVSIKTGYTQASSGSMVVQQTANAGTRRQRLIACSALVRPVWQQRWHSQALASSSSGRAGSN
jgi:hypothetical protein